MAMEYAFFNAAVDNLGNYDRAYVAEDFARYFASFIGNGVFPNPSTNLQVLAPTNPGYAVQVLKGDCWINGYYGWTLDTESLTLNVASGTLDRYDMIVARWSNLDRNISLQVIQGENAYTPVKPEPRRDEDYWDLVLAYVLVNRGVSTINQMDIEDTRPQADICGWVHGVVDQLDTQELGIQFQDFITRYIQMGIVAYNEYLASLQGALASYQVEFETWFESIRDILDENTAGNLLNLIQANQKGIIYDVTLTRPMAQWQMEGLPALSSLNSLVSVRFSAPMDYTKDMTIAIGSVPFKVYTIGFPEETADDGLWLMGDAVHATIDAANARMYVGGGGGSKEPPHPIEVNVSIPASAWSSTLPYTATVNVAGMTTGMSGWVAPAASAATTELRYWASAVVVRMVAGNGTATLTALGIKPVNTIPVTFTIYGE